MTHSPLKKIIIGIVLLILAIAVIKFLLHVLLPIAVVIIAGFIVYSVFFKKKL